MLLSGCMEKQKKDELQARPLYDRLGGEKGITAVVDDLVANVVADPNIREKHKRHFRGEVTELKKKLVDQIGQATGGPQIYKGKRMEDAHMGQGITDKDFDALVSDLVKALDSNHVGETEKGELLAMLGKMRPDVVEKQKTPRN
jgi:hemoglobin